MVDVLVSEFNGGLPDGAALLRVVLRLVMAMLCGAAIGYEREATGHAAGLRTHMLVSLGAAMFVLIPTLLGWTTADMSRVEQGIIAGIGFLGAGSILKLSEAHQIRGLTTAAGMWVTTAIGVAVGLGRIGVALICMALALFVLTILHKLWPASAEQNKA